MIIVFIRYVINRVINHPLVASLLFSTMKKVNSLEKKISKLIRIIVLVEFKQIFLNEKNINEENKNN